MGGLLLPFDDAYVGNHDDRLLRDDVCGSNLLGLGAFYFRGNVGLLWIRIDRCILLRERRVQRMECEFVGLRLYRLRDEVD